MIENKFVWLHPAGYATNIAPYGGGAPFFNWSLTCFLGKITKHGTNVPAAFIQATSVIRALCPADDEVATFVSCP